MAEAQEFSRAPGELVIVPADDKAGRAAFVDYAYRRNAADPNWVANLRMEEVEKFTPGKNPFFDHARVQLFLAKRGSTVVGRISAHIDELAASYEKPADVVRWYFSDNRRLAEVEAVVIENNVTEFVLGKAKVTSKAVSFDELMAQQG